MQPDFQGVDFEADASVVHERLALVPCPDLRRRLERAARAFARDEAVLITVRGGRIVAKIPA